MCNNSQKHNEVAMQPFIGPNFLLDTPIAQRLYHDYAEGQPIIDYHSHLSPQKIAEDYHFRSITEIWLEADPLKWRAMRANGISEKYIPGEASDWEKFQKWAETLPYLFRNPLYHWAHLELQRVFGISTPLSPDTAEEIYKQCNDKLRQPEFSARSLIRRFNVKTICTSNDICDTLVYHKQMRKEHEPFQMLATWKPDRLFMQDKPERFCHYIQELCESSDMIIRTFDELLEALRKRHAFFHSQGCRMSDVSLDTFYITDYTAPEVDEIFQKILYGHPLPPEEQTKLKAALLMALCELDYKAGWTQQYHIGSLKDVNTTMFKVLGRHTGFDAIDDQAQASAMGRYFNRVFERGLLCRTIVYNLNPRDFEMFAVMLGCFQDGSYPGKMQLGPAWWFMEQEDGIRRQINALSRQGLLSRFVGWATDSHCFLTYTRHEYFRRILCNLLGDDITRGLIPAYEESRVGQMIREICYGNAQRYFHFSSM